MWKRSLTWLSLLVVCSGVSQAQSAAELFEARVHEAGGKKLPYRLLKPAELKAGVKYPLVVFLHGAGERGNDNKVQLVHGMNDFAKAANREKYPCFVIAPQCPAGKKWVEVDWGAAAHKQPDAPSESLQLTLDAIAALEKEFPIDAQRLYITGLSMGGYGTWDFAQRFPDKVAAAAPICGGGDEKQAAKLVKTPIWAFHGDKDTAVKPERSRNMIAAIKQAGGNPKYTEYPGVGHNSWSQTYSNPEFFAWLFAQKLAK